MGKDNRRLIHEQDNVIETVVIRLQVHVHSHLSHNYLLHGQAQRQALLLIQHNLLNRVHQITLGDLIMASVHPNPCQRPQLIRHCIVVDRMHHYR